MKFYSIIIFVGLATGLMSQNLIRKNIDFYIGDKKLLNPLTGGVNNAQVSEADLNLDGKLDLVIFDRDGNTIMPLIYDEASKQFVFHGDYISSFPRVLDWMIMKDYNKDGLMDIFSSSSNTQGIDGIEVYTGFIKNGRLAFKPTISGKGNTVLRWPIGSSTAQIYVSPVDLPTFNDIDEDGDLDILAYGIGAVHVEWYRNMAVERGWSLDSLYFLQETSCYGGFREGGFTGDIFLSNSPDTCNDKFLATKSRHAGSTLLSTDLGDFGLQSDLLIGDISSNRLVALYNNGTKSLPWMKSQNPTWPISRPVNMTVFPCASEIDADRDGITDILVMPNTKYVSANINNIQLYQGNFGTKNKDFTFVKDNYLVDEMLDFGAGTHPCFVDYNQDGLIDLVVGTEGFFITANTRDARLILFENKGTLTKPEFHLVDSNYLNFKMYAEGPIGVNSFTPCFGDLDGDGDLDLLCGEISGAFFYAENIAGPGKTFIFKTPIYNYQNLSVNANSVPYLVDLNRDGLLDIVCGSRQNNNDVNNILCSSFSYFQNQGSKTKPVFNSDLELSPNTMCLGNAQIDGFYKVNSAPFIYDFNGKYKMFSGSLLGKLSVFSEIEGNINGKFKKEESDYGQLREGEALNISMADIDNDGVLDMVFGNGRGGISMMRSDYKTDGTRVSTNNKVKYKFDAYPNPFTNYLNIEIDNSNDYNVELYNLTGKIQFRKNHCNEVQLILPEQLPKGIYIIKIQQDKTYFTKKMVKL